MGLMDKLRDMFTEEVEEKEPEIKSEMIHVEIPAPKPKEEKYEEEAREEKIEKPEKPQQPIFFDDNDFATLEPPKKTIEKITKTFEKPKKQVEIKEKKEEKKEKKVFKPTPIISPVYGILDKNYHKEDIKQKNNTKEITYHNSKEVSIDDIRKKAYGTLEDDLEITLFGELQEEVDDTEEIDMFDELMEEKPEEKDESDLFNLIDSMYEKEGENSGNGK